ncbi:MAG: acylphosphatase [Burkholderiaceae bacterium]
MKTLPPNHNVETITVRITGRVQGVGFRAAAVRQAHLVGVTGWVRNARDTSVEVLLQGTRDQIDLMLSWLHRGPRAARVDAISSEREFTDRHFDRFEQQ